jgi:predicted RNase H-like nuclease (RuvC/YqgF family)
MSCKNCKSPKHLLRKLVFEERNTEGAALKKSIKSMNIEIDNSKKDSLAKNKFINEKENEVYKLEQKCQNLADSLKKSKADNSSLKSENSVLIKKKMAKVKKVHNVSTNTSPAAVEELITLSSSMDQLSSTLALIHPSPAHYHPSPPSCPL